MTKKQTEDEGTRPIRGFRAYDAEWAEIVELARGRGMKPAPYLRQLAREDKERLLKTGKGRSR